VVGTLWRVGAIPNNKGAASIAKNITQLLLDTAVNICPDCGRHPLSLVRIGLHEEQRVSNVTQRAPRPGVCQALWRELHPLTALGPRGDETVDAGLDELIVREKTAEHDDCSPAVAVPIVVVPHACTIFGVVVLHVEVVPSLLVGVIAGGFVQPQCVECHVIVVVAAAVEASSIWH
jgi:hypothetical protein